MTSVWPAFEPGLAAIPVAPRPSRFEKAVPSSPFAFRFELYRAKYFLARLLC
jgi:hypothetical protein